MHALIEDQKILIWREEEDQLLDGAGLHCLCFLKYGQVPKTHILVCLDEPQQFVVESPEMMMRLYDFKGTLESALGSDQDEQQQQQLQKYISNNWRHFDQTLGFLNIN